MRTSKDYLSRACYIAKESATIIYVWQRLQGRQETGDALQWEKKKVFGREAFGMRTWREANKKQASL